jgi:S-adenosylmethionine hydrolase
MSPRPLITLTTDFGPGSPYVAQMKGVILSRCREVDLVDITHAIEPQNIREGAVVLADATPRFPAGTIHVAVVDPGVGTSRRLIYAEIGAQRYLAPDNGLVSLLVRQTAPSRMLILENRDYWLPQTTHTFHGRDILAPVAANLAAGIDAARLGPALSSPVMLKMAPLQKTASSVTGEVIYVDSFGNAITNINAEEVMLLGDHARLKVECQERTIHGLIPTYGAALPGELVALFDSQGRLEIATSGGSAARELGIAAGTRVHVVGQV